MTCGDLTTTEENRHVSTDSVDLPPPVSYDSINSANPASKISMAISTLILCMAAVIAVGVVSGATHHQSAPAPAPSAVDCSGLIMNMADCLTYVSSGSEVRKPEGNCCAGLKTMLRTRAECLCEGLKSSSQMGIVLNVTKAATLPAACSLSAPSVSNCGLNVVTEAAPVGAPTGVPGLTPDQIAPTQGNSGSNALSAAAAAAFVVSLVSGFAFHGLIMSAV